MICYQKTLQKKDIGGGIYVYELGNGQKMNAIVGELKDQATAPPHAHPQEQFGYIIKGGLVDKLTGQVYPAGVFGFFPEGLEHGPHTAPVGALMIEFRHYKSKPSRKSK